MKRRSLPLLLIFAGLATTPASGQNHTRQGATLGGLAGAIAGAAIGKQNNETAAGALIGGALGLATGAAIGSSRDADLARSRAYQQQMHWKRSRAVSTQDVLTMTHSGLGDALIINHIHQNGVQRRLEVSDVIALHRQGVSEAVITALQRAPIATVSREPARPVHTRPVIIEEHHYVRPPYWSPPPRHYYRHYHYRHPRTSWGVHIGF